MVNNKKDKVILVCGATGRQGGATASRLLKDGWSVRILTRDPGKPQARQLADQGATICKGDMSDKSSLKQAAGGCYGVFSVQDPYQAGIEGEIQQGKNVADAAQAASVEHFVYTSVGSANKSTGIPFFESKWQIEQYIRSLDLPCTILRPVFFMDNLCSSGMKESILGGKLSLALKPERSLQLIAVCDIGGFAVMAFNDPQKCRGREYDLAGDELTMPEVAKRLSQAIGREVRYEQQSIDQVKATSPDLAKMYEWFNKVGYHVDIKQLRTVKPDLMTFDTWVKQSELAKAKQPAGAR